MKGDMRQTDAHETMRLPPWLRGKHGVSALRGVKSRMREHGLSTVCEEARCPNKTACFSRPTAAFLLLGDTCTRNCRFCSVKNGGPAPVDPEEPRRVAEAARAMGLTYVVITSVTRDDLPDGGAGQFAAAIREVKRKLPGAALEVLTPDFLGKRSALERVVHAGPHVFNHNVETVPRLYRHIRPSADYRRSLGVLAGAKSITPSLRTKSGLMAGLGEKFDEVIDVMADLRHTGCEMLTIGQYLRPSRRHAPVREYVPPETFEAYRMAALGMGFGFVASAPLARSSMNAEEMYGRRHHV
jgi:lipoic acid synthetase